MLWSLISFFSVTTFAAEELENNDLDLKVERIENQDKAKENQTGLADESLFDEKNQAKIKKYKQEQIAKQKEVKNSYFVSKTAKIKSADTKKLFDTETASSATKQKESEAEDTENNAMMGYVAVSIAAVLVGMIVSVRVMKKGERINESEYPS